MCYFPEKVFDTVEENNQGYLTEQPSVISTGPFATCSDRGQMSFSRSKHAGKRCPQKPVITDLPWSCSQSWLSTQGYIRALPIPQHKSISQVG